MLSEWNLIIIIITHTQKNILILYDVFIKNKNLCHMTHK